MNETIEKEVAISQTQVQLGVQTTNTRQMREYFSSSGYSVTKLGDFLKVIFKK